MRRSLKNLICMWIAVLPGLVIGDDKHLEDTPAKPKVSQIPSPMEAAHQIDSQVLECRIWLVLHTDVIAADDVLNGTPVGFRFHFPNRHSGPNPPERHGHLVFSLVHGPTMEVLGRLPSIPINFNRPGLPSPQSPAVQVTSDKWRNLMDHYSEIFDGFSLVEDAKRVTSFAFMAEMDNPGVLSEFGRADAKRLVAMAMARAPSLSTPVFVDMASNKPGSSLPTKAKCIEQGVEASLFSRALDQVINRSINVAVLNNLDNFVKNLGNQAATDRRETVRELIRLVKGDPYLLQELQDLLKSNGQK